MRRYTRFGGIVASALAQVINSKEYDTEHIHHLLNGGASEALQEYIDRDTRLKFGMFFSGQRLASSVADLIQEKIVQGAVIADPACGAGDLLLACLSRASLGSDLQSTLTAWGQRVLGLDIHTELARVARERISLLAAIRLRDRGTRLQSYTPILGECLPGLRGGDYLGQRTITADADCVVMNPPFTETDAPDGCEWSSGKVQQAAIFTAAVLSAAKINQEIVAVLPDVLRSGTRYDRWRQLIAKSADILSIRIFGRFDSKTDVDVFILHLRKRQPRDGATSFQWNTATPSVLGNSIGPILSDRFHVSVGAVVPYRHNENEGQWALYVDVGCAPANVEIDDLKSRRFNGRLHKGPFVVLRRTSSPSDANRAVGTLINSARFVAVENHLIVLQPHDGTLGSCRQLMNELRRPNINEWLNATIRCRHLTTHAIAKIPIGDWP